VANQNSSKQSSRKVDQFASATPGGQDQLRDRKRRQSAMDRVMSQMPSYLQPHDRKKAQKRVKDEQNG